MSTNQSSVCRLLALASVAICLAAALAFSGSRIATTQTRIIAPQPSANSNTSSQRRSIATLRANESSEGERLALSSDQSLNDYDAYRWGDRFYVRIPATEVLRPEVVRGRAFDDVKVQRRTNYTVVSFRLQRGATARVEQRGNELDVVFSMPGSRAGASSGRGVARTDAGPAPPLDSPRRRNTNSNRSGTGSPERSASRNSNNRTGNRNSSDRLASAATRPTRDPRASVSANPSPTASAKPSASSTQSATRKTSAVIAQQRSSPSPTPTVFPAPGAQGSTWNNLKGQARYWVLLAQLNPVPVGIGVALLLLFIGFFALQRRRARVTRRARWPEAAEEPEVVAEDETTIITPKPNKAAPAAATAAVLAGTAGAGAALAAVSPGSQPATPTDAQPERVTRASEEVKKLMAGGDYDESIIASEDRYTRQLVGAELLSALVGRDLQRRERARGAFMNHGYFDDATHDLRVAESPNERAAAARRLSFVHDHEATPHLIGALEDSSAEVRRAAVEALMDLRDPAAIAPLNSLLQLENDRRVPRSLIKHAVEVCATSEAGPAVDTPRETSFPSAAHAAMPTIGETEREVIEI